MVKTIDLITDFTGAKPKGFTAPCWANHASQVCSENSRCPHVADGAGRSSCWKSWASNTVCLTTKASSLLNP
jgi:hypothetical protein